MRVMKGFMLICTTVMTELQSEECVLYSSDASAQADAINTGAVILQSRSALIFSYFATFHSQIRMHFTWILVYEMFKKLNLWQEFD